jgi:hypothetical protein
MATSGCWDGWSRCSAAFGRSPTAARTSRMQKFRACSKSTEGTGIPELIANGLARVTRRPRERASSLSTWSGFGESFATPDQPGIERRARGTPVVARA